MLGRQSPRRCHGHAHPPRHGAAVRTAGRLRHHPAGTGRGADGGLPGGGCRQRRRRPRRGLRGRGARCGSGPRGSARPVQNPFARSRHRGRGVILHRFIGRGRDRLIGRGRPPPFVLRRRGGHCRSGGGGRRRGGLRSLQQPGAGPEPGRPGAAGRVQHELPAGAGLRAAGLAGGHRLRGRWQQRGQPGDPPGNRRAGLRPGPGRGRRAPFRAPRPAPEPARRAQPGPGAREVPAAGRRRTGAHAVARPGGRAPGGGFVRHRQGGFLALRGAPQGPSAGQLRLLFPLRLQPLGGGGAAGDQCAGGGQGRPGAGVPLRRRSQPGQPLRPRELGRHQRQGPALPGAPPPAGARLGVGGREELGHRLVLQRRSGQRVGGVAAIALPRLLRRAREHPVLAAGAFALAAAAQFWASQILVSGELPDALTAGEGEELVLAGLGDDPRLLSLEERGGLDVRFDRARPSPATAALLQQLGVPLPAGEGPVAWIGGAGSDLPSLLEVAPGEGGTPRVLRLRPLPSLAGGVARLELEADGPLAVRLASALVPGQPASPRRLRLGDAELTMDGALPLQFQVPAGVPLRLALTPETEKGISLTGGSLREGREGEPGLAMAGLGLRRGEGGYQGYACGARPAAWLWRGAHSLGRGQCAGGTPLRLTAVELKPDTVAAKLAGSGWLWADGQPASPSVLARLGANPALAVLLVAADAALAAWLVLALLNLRRQGRYRIFISYRRTDSAGHAGRLKDCLKDCLGERSAFLDDDITAGTPFGPLIVARIQAAEVVLAVISQHWLGATDKKTGRRRLDDPDDWVRRELETALELGKRLVPVLVGGAKMPGEADLPDSLKSLAGLDAALIEDAHFERDAEALAEALDRSAGAPAGGHLKAS